MKIRRFTIKFGPFRWTQTKVKPDKTPKIDQSWPSSCYWPRPGWYYTQYGYLFWNGHRWVCDMDGRLLR